MRLFDIDVITVANASKQRYLVLTRSANMNARTVHIALLGVLLVTDMI